MAKSRKFGGKFFGILLLAVAAGGWFFWKRGEAKPPEVSTVVVARGDLVQAITATGVLQAPTSVDVSSQISGQIKEVLTDYNKQVKAGDVLARIDPATYESRLKQSRATLESRKASYALTRLNTERTRELRTKNLVSQQELDQAEALLTQANGDLLTAQAAVDDAQVNLERCTIKAPIDGIVLDRQTEVGRVVAASLNAPTLFTLVTDLKTMEISADVSEADIGSVAVGQDVTFTVDAYPNREFRGRVVQIRNLPKTAQSVVVYATIIEVDNSELRLKPGMTASVSIITARRTGVLKVANAALRARIPEKFQPTNGAPAAPPGSPVARASAASTAPGSVETGAPTPTTPATREQMRALMQEAGVVFTPGSPPSAADIEKIRKLAAARGLELPERFRGRERAAAAGESPVLTRTVYKITQSAPDLKVEAVPARFGISDGLTTEVIDGLAENDAVVTSIYVSDENSAGANRSPFSGSSFGSPRR